MGQLMCKPEKKSTQDKVLEAAEKIFSEKGFTAVQPKK
jgi:hypothetical protein